VPPCCNASPGYYPVCETPRTHRDIFEAEHEAFRDLARTFVAKEIAPFHEQWERDGQVSRDVWLAAGKAGLLGTDVPEEYGGGRVADFRSNAVLTEELVAGGASGVGFLLQPSSTRACNQSSAVPTRS